jgi:hypothetical protein
VSRRRPLTPEVQVAIAAFDAVVDVLEPAKAGLADVMPGTRMPGRPFHHALAAFVEAAEAATEMMAGWRCPEIEPWWPACDEGLRTSLKRAQALAAGAPAIDGFEGLLGSVESLLDPLEPFADAEAAFRSLRRGRAVRSN